MSRVRLTSSLLLHGLLAVIVASASLFLANCSSGAVCYRQTDCPSGSSCKSGQCVRAVANGDGGLAGGTSEEPDAGTAGGNGTGGDGSATAGGDGASTAGGGGT
ncbi:MAG: hypothetical protein ABUL62_33170 [Myxococcales bacterium]